MLCQNGDIGRIVQTEGRMTFTVTGLSDAGPTAFNCKSSLKALEQALEWVRWGFADVLISEEKGVSYTPDVFFRLYLM
jgi:hypothetical protein